MSQRSRSSFVFAFAGLVLAGSLQAQLVFEAAARYPISGFSGAAFATGDLDVDGDADVIVIGSGGFDVLLNAGDGTFAAPLFVPGVGGPMRLAHLNGDAFLDLVVATGAVDVRMGVGDGTFGPATTIFTTPDGLVRTLTVAEVTGDAHLDVIAHNGQVPTFATERVDIIPGNGDGTFGAAYPLAAALPNTVPQQSVVGDLNGDRIDDILVVTGAIVSASAYVYLGTGGGAYTSNGFFAIGLSSATRVSLVDVNDDGDLDLITTGSFGLAVRLGNGDASFSPSTLFVSGLMVGGSTVADFDLDGHLDVACRDSQHQELVFLRGASDGTFTENLRVTGLEGGSFFDGAPGGADFDGDGFVDIGLTEGGDVPVAYQVFRNHTYGPGAPFLDLGFSLPDDAEFHKRTPIFLADGTLVGGEPVTLQLQPQDVSSQVAWLVKATSPIFAPFKGGTMVPDAQLLTGPFVVPPAGLQIAGPMPAGVPPGTQFWMQFWFQPGGPGLPFSATSGIEATAP